MTHTMFTRACVSNAYECGRINVRVGECANTHPTLTHHSASSEANREAS